MIANADWKFRRDVTTKPDPADGKTDPGRIDLAFSVPPVGLEPTLCGF